MTPDQLHTLWEAEWPSIGVGWPLEGTMNLTLIKAVYAIFTGKPGHPDQFPNIDSWLGIAQDPLQMGPFLRSWQGRKSLDGPKGNQG